MGRIQKKKDPVKKKAQQLKKVESETASTQGHNNGAVVKPVPWSRSTRRPIKPKA
jgi:hypothetical protein